MPKKTAGSDEAYKPMMSPAEAKKRLTWQDKLYEKGFNRKRRLINFHGRQFVILPGVFEPAPWEYNISARTVLREVRESDKALDMGTWCGVQAILAASKAASVTAVDLNPHAIRCARINVKLNGASARVKVIRSDLFGNLKEKFEIIIFFLPFRWSKPRNMWDRSTADENYQTLRTFLTKSKQHLNKGGRIVLTFGTSGDM